MSSHDEGYLMVDHRASPGIPEEQARKMGYDPSQVGEGKVLEAAMKFCAHCQQPVVINPLRTRERAHCMACSGKYVCDNCAIEMRLPNYVHMPIKKIVDLVGSGKATAVQLGVRPLLLPTKPIEV